MSSATGTLEETLDALTFGSKTNSNLIGIKTLSESTKSLSSSSSIKSNSSISAPRSFKNTNYQLQAPNTMKMNLNVDLNNKPSSNHHELVVCQLCKKKLNEPKLLNCLHVFCKTCLIAHSITDSGDSQPNLISCPKCKQETLINGPNGIDCLEDDYVMHNILDMIAIEDKMLDCTSCKTDEKAVARCSDCAHFLCPSCVSAHEHMRCFESHLVVKFDEIRNIYRANLSRLQQVLSNGNDDLNPKSPSTTSPLSSSSKSSASSLSSKLNEDLIIHNFNPQSKLFLDCGVPIHKPLFCKQHTKECLKFFCNTCQIPICSDCVVSTHQQPMHSYERIADAETRNLEEIDAYLKKIKDAIIFCQGDFQTLDQYLAELQDQLESSKSLIEETYQTYKVVLERRKNEILKELEEKHSSKELGIMDLHNSVDMSINQLNDVIKFSERITRNGNTAEILLLKKSIINQVRYLTNNLPQVENLDINLKFVSDEKRFEKAIADTFGRFYTQKEFKQNYLNNLQNNNNNANVNQHQHQQQQLQLQQQQIQQLQQMQKQLEIDQHQLQHSQLRPESIIEQQWLNQAKYEQIQQQLKAIQFDENLLKNLNQLGAINGNGTNTNISPVSPSSLNEDWTSQIMKQQQMFNNFPSTSPIKSSNQWMPQAKQQQHLLNNLHPSSFLQQQQHQNHQNRSQSPFDQNGFNNQQHHLNSPRSHTPMMPIQGLTSTSAINVGTNLNGLNSIGSGSSLGSSAGSSNININQNPVLNGLEEFLPFSSTSTISAGNNPNLNSMAQNLNQLSKFMHNPSSSQNSTHLNDLTTLSNLNELALTAGLNIKNYNDANSSSSQSPPLAGSHLVSANSAIGTIGSGMAISAALNSSSNNQSTFSGNGNLNPPVRQNGKMSNMQIRIKFGTLGSGKAQFNSPHGFCLGIDEEIIVADTNNHRIQIFDKNGEFKYSFGSPGREEGQLWYPRKVTVMRDTGKFVVCDRGNERSRMQIFNKNGHFLKKISIRYIDIVAGLAITQNGDIVAVDSVSPTVFRIGENGELKKWFDCSDYMREPSDIAINGNEYYVCDFKGHCVAVFNDEGEFVRRIGGENITNFPNGIDVSDAGDVLVGDSHGNRFHVAVFSREGTMISEFECPYVKVSRCCGLKITSEGLVVTLAKNNHHVLVLNTLYVS